MKIDCAVVGCGAIGSRADSHAPSDWVLTHAGACRRHESTALVAGVDPNDDHRRAFEDEWGCPSYATLERLFERHAPDLICVSTPSESHETVVSEIIENGVRGILCEKPLAPTLEAAQRLVKSCTDVSLVVNYTRRFVPGCRRLRDKLHDGDIGSPRLGQFVYTKDFLENGSHMVDLARWWFGEPDDVTTFDDGPVDASMRFGETRCHIHGVPTDAYSHVRADVFGTTGSIHLIDNGKYGRVQQIGGNEMFPSFRKLREESVRRTGYQTAMLAVLDDLVDAVEEGTTSQCDGAEALRTQRLCERIASGD